MKIFALILIVFLFVFACSNDLADKKAPSYGESPPGEWATAEGVR